MTLPHSLRDYALLADGERGAVIGPHGDIGWLCVPHWDSGAVFASLLGGSGEYLVQPVETHVWGGSYEDGSLVWRSRWVTRTCVLESRDALACPADPHRAVILRRVRALYERADVRVILRPRADFDRQPMTDLHRHDEIWTARCGALYLRWTGAPGASPRHGRAGLELTLRLKAGDVHDLVLELSDQPIEDAPISAEVAWRTTEASWSRAVPALDASLNPIDTRRSYAVLHGLTSAGGGMVAAATTSLPERADTGRNYDYRYVWIRDQCFAGQAAAKIGADPLLDSAVRFVSARLLEHGERLSPAYTIGGDPVPRQSTLDLPGYPGGGNTIGNRATDQFQLDAFGEALLLLASAARLDRLDDGHGAALDAAADAIAVRWREPDAGIWELEDRHWTHSRLICAAGLRAAAAVRPPGARADEWLSLADQIVAETARTSLRDGRWQRSPEDAGLDGALLLAGLRGAIAADDPRTAATLDAYLADLTRDGYAYRFRHDDRPLHEAEGSFLLCGFLVAQCLHQLKRSQSAQRWYEVTRSACGPPQLFSEEYDARQHQMRGNLPQAFVHAVHLETAIDLANGKESTG